jgi:hypothetical protein
MKVMVASIKSGLLTSTALMPKAINPSGLPVSPPNFGEFMKTDMKGFIEKSNQVEGLLSNYIQGFGDIEEVAPKFKELMLEFELKTKIVSSLANMLKTLTSMQI